MAVVARNDAGFFWQVFKTVDFEFGTEQPNKASENAKKPVVLAAFFGVSFHRGSPKR